MTSPAALDPAALPASVAALLHDDERPLYYAQPIRRAGGIGVWLIMGLGFLFVPASVGAIEETLRRAAVLELGFLRGAALAFVLCLEALFLGFSLMLLVWPWLSDKSRRATHVLVTDARVIELKSRRGQPRVRQWPVHVCEHAAVARRRGASATLVLKERIRTRKTDGKPVYEWDALHGLPRADEALAALCWARAKGSPAPDVEA